MKVRFLTKQLGSKSLRAVADELTKRLKYKVWRSSTSKPHTQGVVYGDPVDKISQYQWYKEHDIPSFEFTTKQAEAKKWASPTTPVFARLLTNSSEGKGIVIAESPGDVPVAPVYTKYIKKKQEFRVHVFKGEVVSVVEKRKKHDWTGPSDPRIRNTANGYVFCHDNVVEPKGLRELALLASQVTPSDFKGVDIGFNEKLKKLFVIETNSAPGIEGTNVQLYADSIIKQLKLTPLIQKPIVKKAIVAKKKPVLKKKKVY